MNRSRLLTRLLLPVAAFSIVVWIFMYAQRGRQQQNALEKERSAIRYGHEGGRSGLAADYSISQERKGETARGNREDVLNRAYSNLEGSERQEAILNGLRNYVGEDPEAAVGWVLKMAPDKTQQKALSLIFTEWAKDKPRDAAGWIMQNLALLSSLRTTAATALATSWVGSSPDEAMQWADFYFNQTDEYFPFQDAIIVWANQDINAAAQHVTNTSYDGATGYIAIMDFLNIYAKKDLEEARKWAEVNVPKDFQAGAQVQIVEELAKLRPSDAASYILQEQNLEYFTSNLGVLLSEWTKSDIVGASEWVDRTLNNTQKDIAYEHLAFHFQFDRPDLAVRYAQGLGDSQDRTEITTDILIDWREQARDEADQWISENIDTIGPAVLEEVGYKVSNTSEP